MSFDNLLTLLIIGGLGYMMFRGGGCCGSHGGHGKNKGGDKDPGEEAGTDTNGQDPANR